MPLAESFLAFDNYRLLLGDNTAVLPTLSAESVHLVVTSPPYPGVPDMWGELFAPENFDRAHAFLDRVWDECLRVLKPGCKLAINIANTKRRPYLPNVARVYWWARERDIEPIGEIIWNKGFKQNGTAWGTFRSPKDPALADQHEYILVFRKPGKREAPEEFNKIALHDFASWRGTMWNIPPAKASKVGHVAPFPIEIPSRLITLYTFEGEVVLDPFAGAGTTGLAALKLGRDFVGIELKEEYYRLAKKNLDTAAAQGTLLLPAVEAGTAKAISLL